VKSNSRRTSPPLRNSLGKRRCGNSKIASDRRTIRAVYCNVGGSDRRSVDHVVVDVDNRPSRPGNAFCECDVEEKTVA